MPNSSRWPFEFAAAQAAAPVTLGASEAGAAAATATTRVMVREIISKAKTEIIQAIKEALAQKVKRTAREMAVDLIKELAMDSGKKVAGNLATQGIKSHFGAQQGFDFAAAGEAAAKPFVDKGKEVVDGAQGMSAARWAAGRGKDGDGRFRRGRQEGLRGGAEGRQGRQGASTASPIRTQTPAAAGDGTSAEGGDGGSSDGGVLRGRVHPAGVLRGRGPAPRPRPRGAPAFLRGGIRRLVLGLLRERRCEAPPDANANTDKSGQDEAERVRNAFG